MVLVSLMALQQQQETQKLHGASSSSLCQIKCAHLSEGRILTACCVHVIYGKDSEYLSKLGGLGTVNDQSF